MILYYDYYKFNIFIYIVNFDSILINYNIINIIIILL